MTQSPERIVLPDDLRPADGRFGSGPSKVRAEAVADLAAGAGQLLGTSHRQDRVKHLVRRIREGVADLLSLPEGYEVLVGNGGTTAFWDAAIHCLVDRRSQHAVFGEFSGKFADAASSAPHLDEPLRVEAPYGTRPVLTGDESADVIALTHNETSTGVQAEIRRPAGSAPDALVVVDATSAAGGLRVDASEFDVYYFAPQKCLASEGGLWIATFSPAAIERLDRLTASRYCPAFLHLGIALENSLKDQTYNTPAIATLFLTVHTLDWILENGGLEFAASRCDESARILYGWADASSYACAFVEDPEERSHTVATIDFAESVEAATVASVLRRNGILDVESYRKLGRNQLRVALYPAIDPGDVESLTRAVDHVVEELRK